MYLKKTKHKNGRIHVDIIENYYDSSKKTSRQVTLKNLGYLDELEKLHDNPEKYYAERIDEYNLKLKENRYPISINFDENEKMDKNIFYEKNFGFIVFSKIYHSLRLHRFLINRQRHRDDPFNANELFKILLNGHIFSKFDRKSWFQKKKTYTTHELIDFFEFINKNSHDMVKWINKIIETYYERDTCYAYENIAIFNFTGKSSAELEINRNNSYNHNQTRSSGYLSLYLDSHGVPYSYRYTNKSQPEEDINEFYKNLKKDLHIKKIVVVGDRTEKSEDELNREINSNNNLKYIFAINPLHVSDDFQKYIVSESKEVYHSRSTSYKTRMYPRMIPLEDGTNKVILEKQVVIRNKTIKDNDKLKRQLLIEKAMSIIENADHFSVSDIGNEIRYIKKVLFLPSGKIDTKNSNLKLDSEIISDEMRFDGLKVIVTNEPKNSLDHILQTYYYQYRLESILKNTNCTMQRKSPGFNENDYYNYTSTVHLVTFVSLVIIQLLHLSIDKKYTIKKLLSSISKCNCIYIQKNYYLFTYFDEVLEDLGKVMNIDFKKRVRTLKEINHMLADVKKTEIKKP